MSLSSSIARRLRSPALADKNPLPGAKYTRLESAALARGECIDPSSYAIDEAPYTESPAERLRAVERHTETIVEPVRVSRWA